jgi:signal peptidase I
MEQEKELVQKCGICAVVRAAKLDRFWVLLTLLTGYPVAALTLLFSCGFSWSAFRAALLGDSGKSIAKEWGESILVAFILAMVIRTFFFQPFKIPSGSMRMTLIEGDRLFVNKLAYGPLVPFTARRFPGFTAPKRGDVIVFRFPPTRDKDYIKRLIAFPGEKVEILRGRVYIDGKVIDQGTIAGIYYYNNGDYGAQHKPIVVPEGQYFVMGDNSASSYDGRYWGFVPQEIVVGRADVIFWPLNRIGRIK